MRNKFIFTVVVSLLCLSSALVKAALMEGDPSSSQVSQPSGARMTSAGASKPLVSGVIQSIDLDKQKIKLNNAEMYFNPGTVMVFSKGKKVSVSTLKTGLTVKVIIDDQTKPSQVTTIYY